MTEIFQMDSWQEKEIKNQVAPWWTQDEKHKIHRNAFSSVLVKKKKGIKRVNLKSNNNKNISLINSLTLKGAKGLTEWTLRKQLFRDATMKKAHRYKHSSAPTNTVDLTWAERLQVLGSIFAFILTTYRWIKSLLCRGGFPSSSLVVLRFNTPMIQICAKNHLRVS